MRITSLGHAVFAAAMIAMGIMGLIKGDFAPIWNGAPKQIPAREALVYLCALVPLAAGLGLLWRRSAALAARVLFVSLLLWLILIKAPFIFRSPLVEVTYQSFGMTAVMVAGAWVLYAWFAPDWERKRLGFATGDRGVRMARLLYGASLIAFGLSHFFYLKFTAPLIPAWLGWPVFWAYFTGCAYLAAGLGVLTGVLARLAAALSAVQMGSFIFLVWTPLIASGHISAFQWGEFVNTCVLTASAWVVADSYRGTPWFAVPGRRQATEGA